MSKAVPVGTILWRDLTVPDAEAIRDFYQEVVGWVSRGDDMGGYEDYNMFPPGAEENAAGICHARGVNANLPAQWLMYIVVADVASSAAACQAHGGKIIDGPRPMGAGLFCCIQDPAGAYCALYQLPEAQNVRAENTD